jgi:bis(5'-nucleosyl)-tetraphosphatase (symmetrical)
MSTYIVGDIQGCLKPLHCLLERVRFDPLQDELWSVGDIVNRGSESLATLRYLKSLGNRFKMVLGNHDLHLLAVAFGKKSPKRSDTLADILSALDRDELMDWLRHQPLLYQNRNTLLVHAGIPHLWSIAKAKLLAREVESILQSNHAADFLAAMYGNEPDCWEESLQGMERLRVITNYFTRMRICRADGTLDLDFKAEPDRIPTGFSPWFAWRSMQQDDAHHDIFFGHWAALPSQTYHGRFHALDSGCVWGGQLTLFDLDEGKRHQCQC